MVGAITLGFAVLIAANLFIASREENELGKIHGYYIPMIAFGPRLEAQFDHVMRKMQDAVAAHDPEELEATAPLNRQLLDDLEKAAEIIYPDHTDRITPLKAAIEKNYALAHDVSLRLMQNETGLPIVNAMNSMKETYTQTNALLEKTVVFDQTRLTEAFDAVHRAQKNAENFQLLISGLCLLLVILISTWISRSVLRALDSLTQGLLRFSQGDFELSIPIQSRDELGDVAQIANQMAKQIQRLLIELKATNKELESFSYSVAHDLRAPLRATLGFSTALLEDYRPILPLDAQKMLDHVADASQKMGELIDGLLGLSRIARNEMTLELVNLSILAQEVVQTLQQGDAERKVRVVIEPEIMAWGDPRLLQIVLANLIGNAWKFTSKKEEAKIEFGKTEKNGHDVFFVRDNGAGFDMKYSEKLFGTFQRLHSEAEFEGTGIGLATVQRIIHRHHGKIWAESKPNLETTFFFQLG